MTRLSEDDTAEFPMQVYGYEPAASSALFRWVGDRLIMVHAIGPLGSPSWGYTIWEEGNCLLGCSDPTWDVHRAKREADAATSLR